MKESKMVTPEELMEFIPKTEAINASQLGKRIKVQKFNILFNAWEKAALQADWDPPHDHRINKVEISNIASVVNNLISAGSLILDADFKLRRPRKFK